MKTMIKFIVTILVCNLTLCCQCSFSEDNLIVPGLRVGRYILNSTKMREIINTNKTRDYYAKNGLFFTFEKGEELSSILITSDNYHTKDNIRVGDNVRMVKEIYGEPNEARNIPLIKSSVQIGSIENNFAYNGIIFIVQGDIIITILVVPLEGTGSGPK